MHEPLVSRPWRAVAALLLAAVALFAAPLTLAAGAPRPAIPTWSALSPAAAPPALRGAASAYDGANGTVVVFGGRQPDGTLSDRTWVWNGTTWAAMPPSPYSLIPPARTDASMAYDAALNQLILFGGQGARGTLLDDTWLWNGATWIEVNAPSTPGARAGAALATDANGRLVLFGGYGTSNAPVSPPPTTTTTTTQPTTTTTTTPTTSTSSTSSSSSSSTTTTTTTTTNPSPTDASGDVPATPTAGAAVPGGSGAGNSGTTPVARRAGAPETRPATLDDTWLLEATAQGDDWIFAQTPVHPSARLDASMVGEGGRSILFGGTTASGVLATTRTPPASSVLGGTWNWNGSAWKLIATHGAPPSRAGAAADDDTAMRTLVLFGGTGSGGVLNDVWSLSGITWRRLGTSPAPAARFGAVSAYDGASHQLLLFGGVGAGARAVPGTYVLTPLPPIEVGTSPSTTSTTTTTVATGSHSTPTTRPATGSAHPAPPRTATAGAHPGGIVTLSGKGFAPHARVLITFGPRHQVVAVTKADADGRFRVDVTVPDTHSVGTHNFQATGRGPGGPVHLVTPIRVAAYTTAHGPSPTTMAGLVAIALVLPAATFLALGAVGRMRRRAAA